MRATRSTGTSGKDDRAEDKTAFVISKGGAVAAYPTRDRAEDVLVALRSLDKGAGYVVEEIPYRD